ncbi:MAG: hypothetical protein MUE85_18865 [Microscillaceae bacterium]|jgi:hypothetical protein|nr:hypothetical protein [Microscillaceae bacterium]
MKTLKITISEADFAKYGFQKEEGITWDELLQALNLATQATQTEEVSLEERKKRFFEFVEKNKITLQADYKFDRDSLYER